ncbi:putative PduO-type ATP--cob(I)alamin adenosyltransferase [Flavihumibacter petaseus NBRC 106054]|uniref:Corrinoid adenosyltransferase n=1 Tax=Flavihumibacter petaseus NBRC 106054 TaxID=1220578 RepID=A0A0E9MU47_9BACT|nr:putative PduO-type ATP--cob(I)alamin adenosyltransferase [Flavihumibacter petaseus NBRC 106054]
MKIYTRTGDAGHTSLIGGTKVPKSHLRIDTYGTVDELNSHIGFCADQLKDHESVLRLKEIQDRLFTIGASLATDPEKEPLMRMPDLLQSDVDQLEKWIDQMNEVLPPMKFFILPGGHMAISSLHISRCVCRRAERLCVALQDGEHFIDPLVIKYINRLSDYLFVLARYSGHLLGVAEIPWKPRVKQ